MNCPICGAPVVDMTTMQDREPRWLCIADPSHDERAQCPPEASECLPERKGFFQFLSRWLKWLFGIR